MVGGIVPMKIFSEVSEKDRPDLGLLKGSAAACSTGRGAQNRHLILSGKIMVFT